MTITIRVLICAVVLLAAAFGQGANVSQYIANGRGAEAFSSGPNSYSSISYSETSVRGPNSSSQGYLYFYVCAMLPPTTNGMPATECIYGSGQVPGAAISGNSDSAKIHIADLNAVPGFYTYGYRSSPPYYYPEPIVLPIPFVVDMTCKATGTYETDQSGNTRTRFVYPDGMIVMMTTSGSQSHSAANLSGNLGDMKFPLDDLYYATASVTSSRSVSITRQRQKN